MLVKTSRSSLTGLNLSDFDAIVLVEGAEAEVFTDPAQWFPGVNVLAVGCGGFQGVGAAYESLLEECGNRLLPTVDQDNLTQRKPAQDASAWNSPNLYQFCWTFEDIFDDWMLSEALSSGWTDVAWELSENEVAHIRADAQEVNSGILEAVEEYGRRKYPDQGFQLPRKPEVARRLGKLIKCNIWIPRDLGQWIKEIYLTAGVQMDQPSVPEEDFDLINWEVARAAGLTGFLVACEGGRLLAIDFDQQTAGSLNIQPATIVPSAKPMFSPKGDAILFQGKSIRRGKTVSGVLRSDGTEIVIDIGGTGRGTSVCDWDPRAGQFLYIHGADTRSYRMWRRSLSGSTTTPVEPETHGGVLCRVGRRVLGLGSSNNHTQSFQLEDIKLVSQKDIAGWHSLAEDHETTAFAWDYHRDGGFFALAQPIVRGGGDSPMRVFVAQMNPEQEIVGARLVARPLRRVMSLCWSPDSRYLIATSVYEKVAHLVDISTGCLRPLIRGQMRVSGRSWLSSKPSGWCPIA